METKGCESMKDEEWRVINNILRKHGFNGFTGTDDKGIQFVKIETTLNGDRCFGVFRGSDIHEFMDDVGDAIYTETTEEYPLLHIRGVLHTIEEMRGTTHEFMKTLKSLYSDIIIASVDFEEAES